MKFLIKNWFNFFSKNQASNPSAILKEGFIDSVTGRHSLDRLYEKFAKPQVKGLFEPDAPSIYINHNIGQKVLGDYIIDQVFEDKLTGFYAEGRLPLKANQPPVLVIRGYGSWYPFYRVLEDTPDVFIASWQGQLKAAEKKGAIAWLKQHSQQGQKPDIIGESLGGKVAQQIVLKYSDYIRSTVTYNSLGISPELTKNSKINNIFHYFTLGERYAFWANQGSYLPGYCFQISKRGVNWVYKLENKIIAKANLSEIKKHLKSRNLSQLFWVFIAQIILLKRHNDIILNCRSPVVDIISLDQLQNI
ncbi:conserved hypothetical protein [Planktothrix serta PCC 8927]|uniref:Uncharacterized protein n=1 Tax=Planktothrix serta PCC 8927 TaxID=671068 RepID=A0A7Z9BSX3_9CYAN|nr:alpha/beta hydrolase [Planktothrix serta]VXD20326.1 conserved hypothetical protein [Planktothrix serta PCC 8927]